MSLVLQICFSKFCYSNRNQTVWAIMHVIHKWGGQFSAVLTVHAVLHILMAV